MWDGGFHEVVEREPGLARERTELAWNRSGLGLVVAVTILLRRLWPLEGEKTAVALGLIGAGTALWALGTHLTLDTRRKTASRGVLAVSHFRILTVGTLVLAAAGFVAGVVLPL